MVARGASRLAPYRHYTRGGRTAITPGVFPTHNIAPQRGTRITHPLARGGSLLPVEALHPVAARHTAGALHTAATVPFVNRPRLESAPDAPSPGWNILIQSEQTPVPVDKCNINRKTHPDRMDGIAESKSHALMRRQRSTLQKSARTRPRRPSPEAFANLRKPRQRNRFRFHDIRRNRIPSRKRLNMVR